MNRPVKIALALLGAGFPLLSFASSHREAPFIAGMPKVDLAAARTIGSLRPLTCGAEREVQRFSARTPSRSSDGP